MEYRDLTDEQLQAAYHASGAFLDATTDPNEKWAVRLQRQEMREVARSRGLVLR
jgi:hypothetical protein